MITNRPRSGGSPPEVSEKKFSEIKRELSDNPSGWKFKEIMNIIYEKTGIKGSPITVWERLAKFMSPQVTPNLNELWAAKMESLRKYLANISTDVSDFNSSKQMGQENDG